MIKIVDEAECRKYRSVCSITLKKVCSKLKEKGISAQFTLVGSGARNMVTRNGDGPYDLGYNIEIVKAPDKYLKDLRSILHFKNEPTIEFSFDVAIVAKNSNGTLCGLVHNKNVWGYGKDQYVWNEIPNSIDVMTKARQIKAEGLWTDVRNQYVRLKEMYLSRWWDKDHPSFVVYIEAVNNVYNKYFDEM